jgi:hypothetical protein
MTMQDSSPSSPCHQSVLRAIDPLIARKNIRLLGALFPVNPTSMLPNLELMCGDRGPFLAAVAMVVMRLFSSDSLENGSLGKQSANCHAESTVCKRLKI